MFSRPQRDCPHVVEIIPIVEPDKEPLIDDTIIEVSRSIDNHNLESESIILLDISSNKEWVAYVSNKWNDSDSEFERNKDGTYLTRRRFTAANVNNPNEEIMLKDSKIENSSKGGSCSIDITKYIKDAGINHCKFLSISQDGKYIALSFYERNTNSSGRMRDPKNNKCHIFEANNTGLKIYSSVKCNGRAVFLPKETSFQGSKDKEKPMTENFSLAVIDVNTLQYKDFTTYSSNRIANNLKRTISDLKGTVLDLNIFKSGTAIAKESTAFHNAYIKNSSWLDIKGSDDDIKKLITFTRHVRHNIITTPFKAGVVRTWSIREKGVRLTSFSALEQHIMAFSKNYKYTAAYAEDTGLVNIYNVKSGLLVYQLKSPEIRSEDFEISHIRFCYGGRYVAMSGWAGENVIFKIWHLESERSIYRVCKEVGQRTYGEVKLKVFEPFVTRRYNSSNKKCLMGFYMSNKNGKLETKFLEFNIDCQSYDGFRWENTDETLRYKNEYEIRNNLLDFQHLRCGYITIGEVEYLIRFGKHTIQLWWVSPESKKKDKIGDKDKLLYIRAYKGPDYGLRYSFRETWMIHDFRSIKFVGDKPLGRLLVNIRDTPGESDNNDNKLVAYHTEEIFLPWDELLLCPDDTKKRFDYHKLESACQALHYLFTECTYHEHEVRIKFIYHYYFNKLL